jgi:hypothetical protein
MEIDPEMSVVLLRRPVESNDEQYTDVSQDVWLSGHDSNRITAERGHKTSQSCRHNDNLALLFDTTKVPLEEPDLGTGYRD